MSTTATPTKVITGKVRFGFVTVFEPKAMEGGKPKFSVQLLIPKKDKVTVKKIQDAIEAAKQAGKDTKFGGKLNNLKMPLRDGDEEKAGDENEELYKGMYFINATSPTKPGLTDANLNPIMERDEFYSGCYGRASVNFYPFNTAGNKGVACGLNNLQKLEDGEHLGGGRVSAEVDFDDAL